MTARLTRYLVSLTAVAAVAVGGLCATSAVAATKPETAPTALAEHHSAGTLSYTDPTRPGGPHDRRGAKHRGYCWAYCGGAGTYTQPSPQHAQENWTRGVIDASSSAVG
ncbi:hypothetical protein AB0D29_35990 [Streptomyces sp. NPDC048424]|uniref:hypothetical protein n=1 Tax=Streptomyces sp. NPDC048424 TaxID=3155265 RepID=UPI003447FE2A